MNYSGGSSRRKSSNSKGRNNRGNSNRSNRKGGNGRFNCNTPRGVGGKYRGGTNRLSKLLARSIRFFKFNYSPSTTSRGIVIITIIINEYNSRIRSVLLGPRRNRSPFIIALLPISRASTSNIVSTERVVKGLIW